jgi:hypothetical protein
VNRAIDAHKPNARKRVVIVGVQPSRLRAERPVAVLTDERHARRVDQAIGPRSSSFAEAVEALAVATGLRIHYLRVSSERSGALLARQEVTEEVVTRLTRIVNGLIDGSEPPLRDPSG